MKNYPAVVRPSRIQRISLRVASHHRRELLPQGIKQGVVGGLDIGVLSKHSLRLELDAGELVVLDVAGFPLRRRWYVSHREGKRLSRAAQLFLQYLQEEGEEEVAHLLALDQGDVP